jgi:5-oxoprolinase (ATP-hydrolysing) subunit A
MLNSFDINCDCGESFGNWTLCCDEALLPLITTANVACGFHGGDPLVMQHTVAIACEHGIAVGAHPGLRDLEGFGRRPMRITPDEAYAMVVYQTGALKGFLEAVGMRLHHVKPHGALYAMLNTDNDLAEAVTRAIIDTCAAPVLYWPAPVDLHALPKIAGMAGVKVVGEVYFDLDYTDDARIVVERKKTEKKLDNIANRVRRYVHDRVVLSVSGKPLGIDAQSICIHGDGPNAVAVAETVLSVLRAEGVAVAPVAVS